MSAAVRLALAIGFASMLGTAPTAHADALDWQGVRAIALAAPGSLDTTFSGDGKQTVNFGGLDRATKVALEPDGTIVAVGSTNANDPGDYAVARLTAGGAPDAAFDGDGLKTLGTGAGVNDIGGDVTVEPDGKIVVTGQGNATADFVTFELNYDGSPTGPASSTDFGGTDTANAVVRQADGKFVVAGSTSVGGDFAIARLNADGSPDTTFSGDGKQTVDFGGVDQAFGVALAPDGKIVVAGQGGAVGDMAVARLNTDGSVDMTATVDFGGNNGASEVAVQPDGKIVLAGSTDATGGGDFAIARLNTDGSPDATFSGDGKQTVDFSGANDAALGVALQQNGRIVVVGQQIGSATSDFSFARLNADGNLDTTFASGGTMRVDFGGGEFDGDVAVQPDGQIVAAGSTNAPADNGDMAFMRLNGDPPPGGGGGGGGGAAPGGPIVVPGLPTGPKSVTIQPPNPPVFAGVPEPFGVTPSAGSVVDHYDWDLNGDGVRDITCGGDTPQMVPTFPGPYHGPVSVNAVGRDGTSARGEVHVDVLPGPGDVLGQIRETLGSTSSGQLLPRGSYSKDITATCVRPPGLPPVDSTPNGGPPPGCNTTVASAGLVSAIGCFTRPQKASDIPEEERNMLAKLDEAFAKRVSGQSSARIRAHAAASLVAFARLMVAINSGLHVTTKPARVNGLDIAPLPGAALVFEADHPAFVHDEAYLVSSNAAVQVAGVPIYVGPLQLKVGLGHRSVRVAQFDLARAKEISPALNIKGLTTADFTSAETQLGVHAELPGIFGGITGDATITLKNPAGANLSSAEIHATGFQIAGIGVNHADLVYRSTPLSLDADIEIALSDQGPHLNAHLAMGEFNGDRVMRFRSLAGSYTGPPFIPLDPGVDITELEGNFSLFPPKTIFGAGATVAVGGPPNEHVDCPPFDVHGHIDVTVYPGPFALDAHGETHIFCQEIAKAFLHADAEGFVHFGGSAHFEVGPLTLDGNLDARFLYPHFVAEGSMHGCIADYACADLSGIVSDRGLALCYRVKLLFVKITVGGGFDWPDRDALATLNPVAIIGDILPTVRIFFGSCDFSHWRTLQAIARAAGGPPGAQTLQVPPGQRAIALAIKGANGVPPDVEIRVTGRAPIVLPPTGPLTGRDDAIGFRSRFDGTSYVVIGQPPEGSLQIVPRPGSSPVAGVQSELALPQPSIHLTRRPSRNGRITYAYKIKPIRGERITFLEQVGGASRQLLVASRPTGTLSFFPSTVPGTHRTIVAFVTEFGSPRETLTVAHFVAPPTRPAQPAGLRAQRRGTTLRVSWAPAAHAESYVARVRLTDGRSLMFFVSRNARAFTVPGVNPAIRASVRVNGVLGRAVPGPTATLRVAARRGARLKGVLRG
jgi:uncharacterized delta-60 repeat protein